ncbi:MAG: sigma-70 family RNA polymerase sigma factor [Planctomycetales bacterium]|nr:sigma-70 family RNA polymerase sigma factor [Planctomycetales bacterium]
MNEKKEFDTDQLLQSAATGDGKAADELLNRHRRRLRQLVAVRMNNDLANRVDPSDVVQDVLTTAHQRLDDFLREKPIAFYPWLRQITLNRMIDLHRHHVLATKRSIHREEQLAVINDNSADQLARHLVDHRSSPSRQLARAELKQRVMEALDQLSSEDREIVVMRHLEGLSVREIADVMSMPEGTVMTRHFQAVRKLRRMLDE